MANTITVTTKDLKARGNDLQRYNKDLKEKINDLKSQEKTLNGMWEGEANEAFHKAFTKDVQQMDEFYKLIEKYVKNLDEIAKSYDQAEKRTSRRPRSGAINSVGI